MPASPQTLSPVMVKGFSDMPTVVSPLITKGLPDMANVVSLGSPTLMVPSPTTITSPFLPMQFGQIPGQVPIGCQLSPTMSMELVWHGEFDKLFTQYYPQSWTLWPTFEAPKDTNWRIFKDSAKVRFSCQQCGHGWTSMKGRVIFWFNFNPLTNQGVVMFKLYGQQCQRCQNGTFEYAMWYPEEVVKVIGNMYNRVGQIYYGFYRPPLRIDRRAGKPRNQHNASLCQACVDGWCKEEWTFS